MISTTNFICIRCLSLASILRFDVRDFSGTLGHFSQTLRMAWLAQSASCPVTAAATSNGSACRHLVRPADTNRLLSQQHRQMHGHIKEAAIVPLPPVAKSTEEPNALLADGRECHYAPKSHVSSACSAEKPCAAEPTVDPGAHCNRNPGMEGQTAHHFRLARTQYETFPSEYIKIVFCGTDSPKCIVPSIQPMAKRECTEKEIRGFLHRGHTARDVWASGNRVRDQLIYGG